MGLDMNNVPEIVKMFGLGMSPRHIVKNSWTTFKSLFKSQISPACLPELRLHLFSYLLVISPRLFHDHLEMYMVIQHAEFIPDSF